VWTFDYDIDNTARGASFLYSIWMWRMELPLRFLWMIDWFFFSELGWLDKCENSEIGIAESGFSPVRVLDCCSSSVALGIQ
jgi:hypothetical protein